MPSDEEEMQRAFAEFMLSGGAKKKKSKPPPSSLPVKTAASPIGTPARQAAALKKMERKYWQIINAFQGSLQRDWIDVDDHLGDVVSSISNLRVRISMESRYLKRLKQQQLTTSTGITKEDVEMALSYDLLQHEKMMSGARTIMASLSQAQDALGRRLEELMVHHMDMSTLFPDFEESESPSLWAVMSVLDRVQDIYTALALELYRKQQLVQTMLENVQDDLLVDEDDIGLERNDVTDGASQAAADKCCNEWSRSAKQSHVPVKQLEDLLQLGNRGDVARGSPSSPR